MKQKIEKIINTQLNEKKNTKTINSEIIPFYCHEKFSKKFSGYLSVKKIDQEKTIQLEIKVLIMLDTSFDDYSLISTLTPIKNKWQWHASLKINDSTVITSHCHRIKHPSIEDQKTFGEHKLNFGKLFSLEFSYPKDSNEFCDKKICFSRDNYEFEIRI